MENTIANQNSERLAAMSVIFCMMNGINPSDELVGILAMTVMSEIAKWYDENGKGNFNPMTDLVEEDAIRFAFGRIQQIANLAKVTAELGLSE